jgi:peptidoglycan/LPS O-acetylase OafA/YrhL
MALVGETAVLLLGVRFITVSGYPHVILNPFVATLGFTMVAVVSSGFLLLTIERDTRLTRLLQARPLVSLGRISYGMYFFHHLPWTFLATWLIRHPHKHLGPVAFLAVAIFTVTSARLSFRFIESPFLRLKSRIAPTPGAIEDPRPVALQPSST